MRIHENLVGQQGPEENGCSLQSTLIKVARRRRGRHRRRVSAVVAGELLRYETPWSMQVQD